MRRATQLLPDDPTEEFSSLKEAETYLRRRLRRLEHRHICIISPEPPNILLSRQLANARYPDEEIVIYRLYIKRSN